MRALPVYLPAPLTLYEVAEGVVYEVGDLFSQFILMQDAKKRAVARDAPSERRRGAEIEPVLQFKKLAVNIIGMYENKPNPLLLHHARVPREHDSLLFPCGPDDLPVVHVRIIYNIKTKKS